MLATFRAAVSLLALIGFYVFAVGIIVGVIIGAHPAQRRLAGHDLGHRRDGGCRAHRARVAVDVGDMAARDPARRRRHPRGRPRAVGPRQRVVRRRPAPAVPNRSGWWARSTRQSARTRDSSACSAGPGECISVSRCCRGLTRDRSCGRYSPHEFGHFSGAHTRLGPLAYRGWQAIVTTVQQLQGNVIPVAAAGVRGLLHPAVAGDEPEPGARGRPSRWCRSTVGRMRRPRCARSMSVCRSSGRTTTTTSSAWVGRSDLAPTADGFFGGFEKLLAARADDIDAFRAKVPPEEPAEKRGSRSPKRC